MTGSEDRATITTERELTIVALIIVVVGTEEVTVTNQTVGIRALVHVGTAVSVTDLSNERIEEMIV